MSVIGSPQAEPGAWTTVRERLHARGLRWTPQRRTLIEVLSRTDGHVTGAELVERCREHDPATTPSTVYRTLDVLEGLGLVSHSHGVTGREEFHVLPEAIHGHLHCAGCGQAWEIPLEEAGALVDSIQRSRGSVCRVHCGDRSLGCLANPSGLSGPREPGEPGEPREPVNPPGSCEIPTRCVLGEDRPESGRDSVVR